MTKSPNTRDVLLAGLEKALQERVAKVWGNVTQAGEKDAEKRFAEGIRSSAKFYEQAWQAIVTEYGEGND
jgi:hypothetical protein